MGNPSKPERADGLFLRFIATLVQRTDSADWVERQFERIDASLEWFDEFMERVMKRLERLSAAAEARSLPLELISFLVTWPLIVGALIAIETLVWKPFTFYVSLLFFALYSVYLLATALSPRLLRREVREQIDRGSSGVGIVAGPIVYFFAFVLLSRGVWMLHGPTFFEGLPAQPSMSTWVLYGFDHLARVLLFDLFESFDFNLSGVEHAKTFWMSSMVFAFRFTLSISALKVILDGYRAISIERARRGTPDPLGWT